MNKIIQITNLNIDSLLINWGLLSGHLNDGIIEPTKFGRFNQWFTFLICLFTAIKWSILLLIPKDSEFVDLLGDWGYFFGPKIIIDFILIIISIFIITVKFIFLFTSKQKMFYWLNVMDYDEETQSFNKLNLNETESKMFIKRLSLSIFLLKCFTRLIVSFFVLVNLVLILKWQRNYLLNYFVSFVIYVPHLYLNASFIFGFLAILYPVS